MKTLPTTYQYTGNPFTNVEGAYTTSNFVSGTVTLAGPLAPNMALTSVSPTACPSRPLSTGPSIAASSGCSTNRSSISNPAMSSASKR